MSRTDEALAQAATFRIRAQQLEKLPPCQAQCPNSGDIRGWLGIIAQHEKDGISLHEAYDRAWAKIAELNPLPATIGRICPHPCEDRCTRADKDGAVSINAMERFLGDWGVSRALPLPMLESGPFPESIGVIGSGPASLSFAYQMARRGYAVTVYEKDEQAGGMLRHAIPDYRLPRDVLDAEVGRILDLDISFIANSSVGETVNLGELRDQHTLLFLGLGAQAARRLGIPGEDGPGVIPGIEYLLRRKDQAESLEGQRVLVIGGGNTAIDAARSARRDGAAVTLVYRRSEAEMPASAEEIADARDEGVEFHFLAAPVSIQRDNGAIRHVEIQEMQLGEPDESGRRRPEPVAGAITELPADRVFVAVSQAPDWHDLDGVADAESWLHTAADGRLANDIWAGGDDTGPGIASRAIAQGRLAAESAHAQLRGEPRPGIDEIRAAVRSGAVKADYYESRNRVTVNCRAREERLDDPDAEIYATISDEQALQEAQRCMSCGLCFDCELCFMYCNQSGFTRIEQPSPGHYFVLAMDACEGCGKCIEMCPCGYLEQREE
jgi:formate dehydrogenase major subunit